MANVRVNTVVGNYRCRSGKTHVEKANIENAPGNQTERQIDELVQMQSQGDSFVLVVTNVSELDWPSLEFVECDCGSGYWMKQGPSAVELTKQAMQQP